MIVYILFFLILITVGLTNGETYVRRYSLFVALIIWILIGFRGLSVGADTSNYYLSFLETNYNKSFTAMLNDIKNTAEPGYTFFNWFISIFGKAQPLYFGFWALFPSIATYKTIKHEQFTPLDIMVGVLAIFVLSLWAFFVAGVRQTVAISMALLSYPYLKEPFPRRVWRDKSTYKFLLLLFVAYSIHNSALIFAFIYFLKPFLQKRKLKPIAALITFAIAVLFFGSLESVTNFSQFFFEDRFQLYREDVSTLSLSLFFIQLCMFIFCYLKRDVLYAHDESNILLINLVFIGLIFQSLTGVVAEMFRLSYYFSIFYVILLPRAFRVWVGESTSKGMYLLYAIVCLLYLFVLSSGSMEYHFFNGATGY